MMSILISVIATMYLGTIQQGKPMRCRYHYFHFIGNYLCFTAITLVDIVTHCLDPMLWGVIFADSLQLWVPWGLFQLWRETHARLDHFPQWSSSNDWLTLECQDLTITEELFELPSSIWGSSQTFQHNFFLSLHSGFCCPLFHKCWFQGHTSISVLNARLSHSLHSEQSVLQSVPYCPRFERADKLDRIRTQVYTSPSLLSYFCSTHRVFSFYWAWFSFIEPSR